MIRLTAVPGGLILDRDGTHILTTAAQLAAALQRLATLTQGDATMTQPPTTAGRRLKMPEAQQPDPKAQNLKSISAAQAEAEAPRDRMFAPSYPEKTYTIHAVSPQGFAVDLAFNDVTVEKLMKLMDQLINIGWKA